MATSKGGTGARLTALQAGVQKDFTSKTSLQAAGTTYTQATLLAAIASALVPYTALAGYLASAKTARQALKTASATAEALLKAVTPALKSMYGAGNVILLDFGIAPEKAKTPLTASQNVARQAKASATRKMRNTMGKKQKAAIKASGDFSVSVGPSSPTATAPDASADAASAAPAAAAPAAAPAAQVKTS